MNFDTSFKQKVITQLIESINSKIDAFQFALDQLSISVMNETKSTAGDKHETALSMLQAEQSRIAEHLYEAVDSKTILCQINLEVSNESIKTGNLVQTTQGHFFISIALPKMMIEGISVIAISPQSPLGSKLIGQKIGDVIVINEIRHQILLIL